MLMKNNLIAKSAAVLIAGLACQAFSLLLLNGQATAAARIEGIALLLAGAALVAASLNMLKGGRSKLFFWLFLPLCVFMPFYGTIGSLAIFIYAALRGGSETVVEEYEKYIHLQEYHGKAPVENAAVNVMVQKELQIQSYADILRSGDKELKKALIGRLIDDGTPQSAALLKLALKDREYEIRSYASTGLTTREDRQMRTVREIKESFDKDPEDENLRLALASAHLDFATSGLADRGLSLQHVKSAVDILREQYDNMVPMDDGIRYRYVALFGRAASVAGNAAEEKKAYLEMIKMRPGDCDALAGLCEIHFRERDLEALAECSAKLSALQEKEHPAAAAAGLWAKAFPAAERAE